MTETSFPRRSVAAGIEAYAGALALVAMSTLIGLMFLFGKLKLGAGAVP